MKNITKQELFDMLKLETGVHDVTLDVVTIPSLKKTGNPFKDRNVTKESTYTGRIGESYYELANKLEASKPSEGFTDPRPQQDSTPKGRAWGTLINRYLIEHKGHYYLQVFVSDTTESVYKVDGVVTPTEEFVPYFQNSKPQAIDMRDIKFDSIKKLIFKNEEYTIIKHRWS